jgi:hypothetical protein
MERSGVSTADVQVWCADWEEAVTGCSNLRGLGWLKYADSLVRLLNRYHAVMWLAEKESMNGQQ